MGFIVKPEWKNLDNTDEWNKNLAAETLCHRYKIQEADKPVYSIIDKSYVNYFFILGVGAEAANLNFYEWHEFISDDVDICLKVINGQDIRSHRFSIFVPRKLSASGSDSIFLIDSISEFAFGGIKFLIFDGADGEHFLYPDLEIELKDKNILRSYIHAKAYSKRLYERRKSNKLSSF